MKYWAEELAQVEAAALRIESLEHAAERRFDEVHAAAEARGSAEQALDTAEFASWMAARADTDEAWGRWLMVMEAKLSATGGEIADPAGTTDVSRA